MPTAANLNLDEILLVIVAKPRLALNLFIGFGDVLGEPSQIVEIKWVIGTSIATRADGQS